MGETSAGRGAVLRVHDTVERARGAAAGPRRAERPAAGRPRGRRICAEHGRWWRPAAARSSTRIDPSRPHARESSASTPAWPPPSIGIVSVETSPRPAEIDVEPGVAHRSCSPSEKRKKNSSGAKDGSVGRDDSCSASLRAAGRRRFRHDAARAARPAFRPRPSAYSRTGRAMPRSASSSGRRAAAIGASSRETKPFELGVLLERVPPRHHERAASARQQRERAARRSGRAPARAAPADRAVFDRGRHDGAHGLRGGARARAERASASSASRANVERVAGRQVRAIGGELLAQPGDRAGRLDRPRRHPLLNQLEHRRGARLAGALVPGPPDGARGQPGEQHEDRDSGVEQAHAAGAGGG